MDITPLISQSSQVVQAYGSDGFKVSGTCFEQGVIITTEETYSWIDKTVEQLTWEDFDFLKELPIRPEILLLGVGSKMQFIDKEIKNKLIKDYNLTPEVMDTGAACRTYNVLMSEGRHVCAALLLL